MRLEEKTNLVTENSKEFEFDQGASMEFRNTRHDGQDDKFEKRGDTEVLGSQAVKNLVGSDRIKLTDTIAQLLSFPRDQPHMDVLDKGSRDVSTLVGLSSSSTQEAQ